MSVAMRRGEAIGIDTTSLLKAVEMIQTLRMRQADATQGRVTDRDIRQFKISLYI